MVSHNELYKEPNNKQQIIQDEMCKSATACIRRYIHKSFAEGTFPPFYKTSK